MNHRFLLRNVTAAGPFDSGIATPIMQPGSIPAFRLPDSAGGSMVTPECIPPPLVSTNLPRQRRPRMLFIARKLPRTSQKDSYEYAYSRAIVIRAPAARGALGERRRFRQKSFAESISSGTRSFLTQTGDSWIRMRWRIADRLDREAASTDLSIEGRWFCPDDGRTTFRPIWR